MKIGKKIKFGMVGGGPDSFIGPIHRKAAQLDGEIELVCGAFSSEPEKSYKMGAQLLLEPVRVYGSYKEMVNKESKFAGEDKIDFVSIVTPNYLHFQIAKEFIEAGFNIICDKPMACTISEAEELCRLVKQKDILFAVTYNYTGYPMVKQAKELIKKGILGEIRKVILEYHQGWLSTLLEAQGVKQALWRTDPKKTGVSSSVGDVGSHAENLAYYITGLEMERIFADLTTFVPGRKMEDDSSILIHYHSGAKGIISASQVMTGEKNNLQIKVYGTKASLDWQLETPNNLSIRYPDKPDQIYWAGVGYLEPLALHHNRVPLAQSEAYIEAFANIYLNIAHTIKSGKEGVKPSEFDTDFPTVKDGARGVYFINRVMESSKSGTWVKIIT